MNSRFDVPPGCVLCGELAAAFDCCPRYQAGQDEWAPVLGAAIDWVEPRLGRAAGGLSRVLQNAVVSRL